MKFLSLAIVALAGMTEGKKPISSQQLKTRMQKGQFNKRTLMRGAKPYGETARKLEDQAADDQEQWQINGLYSVQFSSCLSVTVQDEDLLGDNYISQASAGALVAEKSYILFTACLSSDCSSSSADKMTFITDIASFFDAFADFLPNQVENYCEGCNNNYNYCMGTLDAQQEGYNAAGDDAGAQDDADEGDAEEDNGEQDQQDGEDQGDNQEGDNQEGDNQEGDNQEGDNQEGDNQGEDQGEGRKLSKVMNLPFRKLENQQVVQMIDCGMCDYYECFAAEDEQEQADGAVVYDFEDALGWLDALSQCQQMDDTYNDLALYSGLICNADGTGVEIGVFMDEYCIMYAPKMNYASMMTEADSQYFALTEEVVEYMFTTDFSCYQPDIQYTNSYEYEEQEADDNADEEQDVAAAEWCENLFNGDMEAVNMYDCGGNQADDGEEAAEDENLSTYSWYSYQLTQDEADDSDAVCAVIKGFNGEKKTVYDKSGSGTLYTYKKNWGNNQKNGMKPGGVATLVIFIIAASAGAAFFFAKSKKGGDKRAPLLNAEGTMA